MEVRAHPQPPQQGRSTARPASAPTHRERAHHAPATVATPCPGTPCSSSSADGFYGVCGTPLLPKDGVIHSARRPLSGRQCPQTAASASTTDASPAGEHPSGLLPSQLPVRYIPTQRDVLMSLRQKIIGIESKLRYGMSAASRERPRFFVSTRMGGTKEQHEKATEPQSLPAAPLTSSTPATTESPRRPTSHSDQKAFQISKTSKTTFDIQVEAAKVNGLRHKEPFVSAKSFASQLRVPEEETKEYYDAAVEAGYYKRWVYGIDRDRRHVPIPPSVVRFFGDDDAAFAHQDEAAAARWKDRVLGHHTSTSVSGNRQRHVAGSS